MLSPVGRRVAAFVVVVLVIGVVSFGALAPPERCPAVTVEALRASAVETVDWFTRNQQSDGSWLYEYDRTDDTATPDYNEIRHTGAVEALYQAATAGIDGALASGDKGLDWATDRLVERDGWTAVGTGTTLATGTVALLLAGLVERRDLTGDPTHDELMTGLGRFLETMTEPSGAVLAFYDTASGAPLPGNYSKYYTGEAYWALTRLHRQDPSGGWGEVADRIGHYLATARDDVEDQWPAVPDHWAAYGLAETTRFPERTPSRPLTDDEATYARRQAELFGAQVRFVSQRFGPWGAAVRSPHVPRGGGYGVLGEGLTGLWLASRADPRLADLEPAIAERAVCNAGLALAAQSDAADAARYLAPAKVEGAWFRDGVTRMDDQQHALSGLLRTVPIVQATAAHHDNDVPSGWLWLAVLVLALNPLRAVFGVPGTAPRRRVELAALGSLGGLALVVAVAALSDWLLDAVDVSAPSMRIAAGAVAAIGGAVDLFRRPPRPDPALPGRWAALVPVAVPLVARPVLLVLALSAAADHGVGLVALSTVLAVVVLTALAATGPPEGAGGRVLRWAARVAAAGLVAGSVVLVVSGVLSV